MFLAMLKPHEQQDVQSPPAWRSTRGHTQSGEWMQKTRSLTKDLEVLDYVSLMEDIKKQFGEV
jgi:hypothetical protein